MKPILASYTRGFTILEIIIVVAVIGIIASVLIGSLIQDTDRIARLEANRFLTVATEVRDEAVLQGTNYVLNFTDQSYQFEQLNSADDDAGDALLKPRKIDPQIELEAKALNLVEGEPARIIFDSIGEVTAFEVAFIGSQTRHLITLDDQGNFERRFE
ncbi:MAG: GspH/FimT family protein [Pseudomonadota bacterium]